MEGYVYEEREIAAALQEAGKTAGLQITAETVRNSFELCAGSRCLRFSTDREWEKSLLYMVFYQRILTGRKDETLTLWIALSPIVIVVSPLVALMEDQVAKGVTAVRVRKENMMNEETVDELHEGQFQTLFFSPKDLLTDETWKDMIQSTENVVGFVIDEVHCVKKW